MTIAACAYGVMVRPCPSGSMASPTPKYTR
uniref:Uncharacterized protein n=1 Tax=Rhizophora mucronata TaxID=61149 RepID=A0A2P2NB29_RHIMU